MYNKIKYCWYQNQRWWNMFINPTKKKLIEINDYYKSSWKSMQQQLPKIIYFLMLMVLFVTVAYDSHFCWITKMHMNFCQGFILALGKDYLDINDEGFKCKTWCIVSMEINKFCKYLCTRTVFKDWQCHLLLIKHDYCLLLLLTLSTFDSF